MKIKWLSKDIIISGLFLVLVGVYDIFIKYVCLLELFESYSVRFNLFFICALAFLLSFFKTKGKLIFSSIVGLIICIYSFAQVAHFQVFNTFFSLSKISMLKELGEVGAGAATSINFTSLQLFIPYIVFIILSVLAYKLMPNVENKHKSLRVKCVLVSAFIVMSLGCGFTIVSYPDYPQHVRSYEYLYERLYNKTLAVRYFGLYSYAGKDFYNTFIKRNKAELEAIDAYAQNNAYQQTSNEYTGLFKDKNLILILAESFSTYSLDPQITPFIYQMSQEGIYFANHYAPLFDANTADSELIALTSTMPSTEGSITPNHYFTNDYNTALPNLFKNAGYSTQSFHSWYKEFYNRYITHQSYGFDNYYADDQLQFSYTGNWKSAYNWPKDTELMGQVLSNTDTSSKFMDFIITAVSHMPYRSDRVELQEDIQYLKDTGINQSNTEIFVYNAALHNLDTAIKTLVTDLEEQGILDDTVIVLFGDHYPYGMSEEAQSEYFTNIQHSVDMYRTPFIIYNPLIESKTITDVTSTFDIYPTLANLFGFNIDGQIVFGNDALDNNFESLVYFADYSWLNNHAYYNASTQETIYFDQELSSDDIDQINNDVIEALSIGQDLLASNSFTYVNGKLEH